jgi:hypothetical protein
MFRASRQVSGVWWGRPCAWVVTGHVAVAIGLLGWSEPASAQTIETITAAAFDRDTDFRPTQEKPFWINREDCLAQDVLHFELKVFFPTDDNLEVWIGDTDCRTKAQRTGNDAECWQVYEEPAPDDSFTIDINVLDVVARRPQVGVRARGTLADCDEQWASSLSFYFMYVDDTDDVVGNPSIWSETGVDLKGPTPPSNVEAGIGEESLVAKWTASNSIDLLGYRIYCAPRQDVALSSLVDGGVVDAGSGTLVSGLPEAGSPMDASAATPVAAPLPIDGSVATADAGTPTVECSAPDLIEGALPGADLQVCGEVTSTTATRGVAKNLENGVEYAIAVAAIDELGNAGRLSNVACGIPEEIDEFYEDYRRAGGGGGGGICGVAAPGLAWTEDCGAAWLVAALVGLLGLVVRRSQP